MKKHFLFLILLTTIFFASNNIFSGSRNLVIEFSTGTWCGFCPCGERVADSILVRYPNTAVIGYHSGGNDPFTNFPGSAIFGMMGYQASPTACINRQNHPGNGGIYPYMSYSMWSARVTELYNTSPLTVVDVVIATKNYNPATRELTAVINSTALQNLTGQYKIHFIITEDNIVYPQNHYEPCGPNGYDSNYVHKWIPRVITNGANGENLNSGGLWSQNQLITKNFAYTLSGSWNADNCKFIAIVYRDSSLGIFASTVQQSVKTSVTGPLGISTVSTIPDNYSLSQNYPNPFNPVTNIKFSIAKDGIASLKIYDIIGNEVSTLINGFMRAGIYNAEIDGTNWSSGVYYYSLKVADFNQTKKMVLVK